MIEWVVIEWVVIEWVVIEWVVIEWVVIEWVVIGWVVIEWVMIEWVVIEWVVIEWVVAKCTSVVRVAPAVVLGGFETGVDVVGFQTSYLRVVRVAHPGSVVGWFSI